MRSNRSTFPDAPPGKYTLRLPYVYMLMKQEEYLTWNLLSCKPSKQVISFPGGSIRTVSITELDEPVQTDEVVLGVPVEYANAWEVAVQCQFDNADITALRSAWPIGSDILLRVKAETTARRLLFGETFINYGTDSSSPGWLDPESGYLAYQLSMDDLYAQTHDLRSFKCNPASAMLLSPMILRYDHPMELEFEVTG